jgi:hypothetical protein
MAFVIMQCGVYWRRGVDLCACGGGKCGDRRCISGRGGEGENKVDRLASFQPLLRLAG